MVQTTGPNFTRACPACGADRRLTRRQKSTFELVCCLSCGTIYTTTLPDTTAVKYYSEYYSAENLSVPEFIHKRLKEIVAGFDPYRQTNRLLEVGFGAGSLLQAAATAGWDVEGVEVSERAVEHGRAAGFQTFLGELDDVNYEGGRFDVVVASDLLEHLSLPGSLIKEVARILRQGGLFWATTPNAKGLSARMLNLDWSVVCPPEHLQLFSENGLKTLFREGGFRIVNVYTEGANPFELMNRLRRRNKTKAVDVSPGTTRVQYGYRLNEALTRSESRKALKNLVNGLLRFSHLGDSLKVYAMR